MEEDASERQLGPLLSVKWGQGAPYNAKIPFLCPDRVDGRAPVGCGPVAVAQILSYFRKPMSYNWNLLLSSPQVLVNDPENRKNEISSFMLDIAERMSTRYKCNGSSTNITDIRRVFGDYGYTVSNKFSFSVDHLMTNLDWYGPILVLGWDKLGRGGHGWIFDGYDYIPPASSTARDHFNVHINWGWNGRSNGWFFYNHRKEISGNNGQNTCYFLINDLELYYIRP